MLAGSLSGLALIGLLSIGAVFGAVTTGGGGFTAGLLSAVVGLRSSTAAPGCSLVSWLAQPASIASAAMLNMSFLIGITPFLTTFGNGAPCRLPHIPDLCAEALPHPAVARYRGQYTTPSYLGCVEDDAAVRRKARRFIDAVFGEQLRLPAHEILQRDVEAPAAALDEHERLPIG